MSVTNRKMFRRDARNKLRNMGGIMASSEPLIQEVAKYQFGGGVDILSEIRNMRPEIRSAFLQSLGNPPKELVLDLKQLLVNNLLFLVQIFKVAL